MPSFPFQKKLIGFQHLQVLSLFVIQLASASVLFLYLLMAITLKLYGRGLQNVLVYQQEFPSLPFCWIGQPYLEAGEAGEL